MVLAKVRVTPYSSDDALRKDKAGKYPKEKEKSEKEK